MRLGEWQAIHFPFEVEKIAIELSQLSIKIPQRSLLVCLRASERLDGVPWTDAFESNFRYLPDANDAGEKLVLEVASTTKWSSAEVSLQPWGPERRSVRDATMQVAVKADGVIGEERREYCLTYRWEIGRQFEGSSAS